METTNDPFTNQFSLSDIASLKGTTKKQPQSASGSVSKSPKTTADATKATGQYIVIDPTYKSNSLTESAESTAVMAFGRMNPPTIGHQKLIQKVEEVADQHKGVAHIVASHSENTSKNPLPQKSKIGYLKKVAKPETRVFGSSKQAPTILDAASALHKAGHKHLVIVAGSDRMQEYHELLHKYNGVEAKHGQYNFKSIKVVSAGHRDPDAEGAEGMSGTKMRAHAKAGDMKKFKSGLPKELHPHAEEIANHIRSVQESTSECHMNQKIKQAIFEKSLRSGVTFSTLTEVFERGMQAWNDSDSVKTAEQYAFDRINSFIACGAAYRIDADLRMVDEVVDMKGRVQRRVNMAMHRRKIEIARKLAMKRFARNKNLRARALKLARNTLRKRVGGVRGANYKKLSTAQKVAVDRMLDDRKKQIKNIANKIVNRVKRDEASRLTGQRGSLAKTVVVASYQPKPLNSIIEATYQGKDVKLNKPMPGDVKKSKVYVDPDGDGKAKKVNFGDKNMTIKKNIPARRASFRARHNCDNPGPKDKARYWSCRAW
jgi:hypothetical protein